MDKMTEGGHVKVMNNLEDKTETKSSDYPLKSVL